MNRRGFTLLETIIAIGFTAVIGAAIAAMMAAATTGLTSKDDGRTSAIHMATTKNRLASYIAPARCILENTDHTLTLWLHDGTKNNKINISEIRWIHYPTAQRMDEKSLHVHFVSFPSTWSQAMIEEADTEVTLNTNFKVLRESLQRQQLIRDYDLIDSLESCVFWLNDKKPNDATLVSARYTVLSENGDFTDVLINESIRCHSLPAE